MILTPETLLETRVTNKLGCWLYRGSRDRNGYGRMFVAGKEKSAPRVFYEVFVAEIPEGGKLRHHLPPGECIGACCCNPAHVRLIVPASGIAVARKLCPKGHLITSENAVVEQRKNGILVRCRTCRQEDWRKQKRTR